MRGMQQNRPKKTPEKRAKHELSKDTRTVVEGVIMDSMARQDMHPAYGKDPWSSETMDEDDIKFPEVLAKTLALSAEAMQEVTGMK